MPLRPYERPAGSGTISIWERGEWLQMVGTMTERNALDTERWHSVIQYMGPRAFSPASSNGTGKRNWKKAISQITSLYEGLYR